MAGPAVPEPAVAVGDDPRRYARLLSAVYDATMAGNRAPARPREVIAESWNRLIGKGIDPEHHSPPDVDTSGLDTLRQSSGLLAILDDVSRGLESVIDDGENILVIADARGRVLWRSGSPRVLSHADRLGFVEGASWSENAVGTNAIGTALASRRAVQIFSAEHFLRSHHQWTCAGAPIKDPRTGHVIGIVDVSGPAPTVHPTTVALVDLVARLAESHLREAHDRTLNRLRTVAAPILARIGRPALAVVRTAGWPRWTRFRRTTESCCRRTAYRVGRGFRHWGRVTSSRCPAAGWSGWPRTRSRDLHSRGSRSTCAMGTRPRWK